MGSGRPRSVRTATNIDKRRGSIHPLGTLGILGITCERIGPSSKCLPLYVCKWTRNTYLKFQTFIPYETSVTGEEP